MAKFIAELAYEINWMKAFLDAHTIPRSRPGMDHFGAKLPPAYYGFPCRCTITPIKEKSMIATLTTCPFCDHVNHRAFHHPLAEDHTLNGHCFACDKDYLIELTMKVIKPEPKAYDANGTELKPGDKVICIKQSEVLPLQIDSTVGKIFTIKGICNQFTNPTITLDCHPFYRGGPTVICVSANSNRFVKIVE